MSEPIPDTPEHTDRRTLVEIVHVPAHPPRVATAAYRAIHHRMVIEEDHACVGCGVRHSTLGDPAQNPYGAKAIETHHHVIEWSLANCIDLDRFNRRIVAHFRHVGIPGYEADFTEQRMLDWIDHSPENLWPLCDRCHRGQYRGIHAITGPIWSALDLIKPGYWLVGEPSHAADIEPPPAP